MSVVGAAGYGSAREMQADTGDAAAWREIVTDARFAPSGHNTQPWRVHATSDEEAELYVPVERTLPVEDPDGKFVTSFVGAFLEALDVAAGARGLALEFEPLHPPLGRGASDCALAARLRLVSRDAPPQYEVELLRRRRTSRLPYDGRVPPPPVLDELSRVAAELGHCATFTSDPADIRWVVDLNADTLFDDLREDDRRAEIAAWTRTSDAEAARAGDGFSPSCLGFPAPLLRLFLRGHRLCEPRPIRALLKSVYLRSMRGTATVGWIAGPWSTPHDCLDAGRMLMRFWLSATRHGLYLQPFGSVITNPVSHARMAERLRVEERDGEVWLLLRLGYGAVPPRSARLPVPEVLR